MKFFVLSFIFFLNLSAELHWDRPVDLSEAEVNTATYRLAVNAKGDAVAIWVEEKIIGPIKLATRFVGEGWSACERLSSGHGINPQAVIDEEGCITAIWMNELPYGNILSATRSIYSKWTYQTLSHGFSLKPHISIDDQGTVLLTWKDKKSGGVFSLTKLLSQDWSSSPEIFKPKKEKIESPEVAFPLNRAVSDLQVIYDKDGDSLIFFKDEISQKFAFISKTSEEGWSEPSFFTIGFIEERPLVKFTEGGHIVILWQDTYSKHLFVTTGLWNRVF